MTDTLNPFSESERLEFKRTDILPLIEPRMEYSNTPEPLYFEPILSLCRHGGSTQTQGRTRLGTTHAGSTTTQDCPLRLFPPLLLDVVHCP